GEEVPEPHGSLWTEVQRLHKAELRGQDESAKEGVVNVAGEALQEGDPRAQGRKRDMCEVEEYAVLKKARLHQLYPMSIQTAIKGVENVDGSQGALYKSMLQTLQQKGVVPATFASPGQYDQGAVGFIGGIYRYIGALAAVSLSHSSRADEGSGDEVSAAACRWEYRTLREVQL
ncbi:hypothetical protein CYMTET_36210, partial [Cymbomonas tetramitiformis]